MAKSTYVSLFHGSKVVATTPEVWTIQLLRPNSIEWLAAKPNIQTTVERTIEGVAGVKVATEYVADPEMMPVALRRQVAHVDERQAPPPPPTPPDADDGVEDKTAVFGGFHHIQSNFVRVPKQYFKNVIPSGPPSVAALVGAIMDQTIGIIINYKTTQTREWWPATNQQLADAAGISIRSVAPAVRLARQRGYIIRDGDPRAWRYRLRFEDDEIDMPDDDGVE